MNKKWIRIEKAIGIFGILFGFAMISLFTYSWGTVIYQYIEDGRTTWNEVSILGLIKEGWLSLTLHTFSIVSGILLLKSSKVGWITSILIWIYKACLSSYRIFETLNTPTNLLSHEKESWFLIICFVPIFFVGISIVLMQKPFREKYNLN